MEEKFYRRTVSVFALLLALMLVFAGCRSSKETIKTDTDINVSDSVKDIKVASDSSNMSLRKDVSWMKEWMTNFSFDFNQIKTDWSSPDSTGTQHPISTTETTGKATTKSSGKENYNEKVELQYAELRKSIETIERKIDYNLKQKQVTTIEPKRSWWQTTLIWTGTIAWFIVFIPLILKIIRK